MSHDSIEPVEPVEPVADVKVDSLSPTWRFFLDMAPLGVFFIAFRFFGLMTATAALMICTCVNLAIIYAKEKKLAPMPLVTGVMVAIFGTLTLVLDNPQFIKMKPTMVNLLFACVLLGGLLFKKPMLKWALSYALQLEERGWWLLSFRWGVYFVFLAILNECIWRNFSESFWVNFKVFGMLGCTLLFTVSQLPLIERYRIDSE